MTDNTIERSRLSGEGPIIGVTSCSRMADYVASVEAAGGRVRVIEVGEDAAAALAAVDALLLTGGGDVEPRLYGEARHPKTDEGEPGRDQLEIDLVRACVAGDRPLLGICRGLQVMNVALGGSLIQDIPDQLGGVERHQIQTPKDAVAHQIVVTPGTRLSEVLSRDRPAETCAVNSRHHQAVRTVAPSLAVSATAPDGVIEGIERPGAPFCVGVQWHPENFWRSGEFRPLFEAFIRAASQKR